MPSHHGAGFSRGDPEPVAVLMPSHHGAGAQSCRRSCTLAFVANVLRVLTLVLVTYYFGDSAGHSFHDYAGYAEIAFAFGAFFVLDSVLVGLLRSSGPRAEKATKRAKSS
jgi:exosortase/archaeosortase family protein